MIVFKVEQGSPEWFECRAGKITASMFSEVRKTLKSGPNKGGHTAAADNYAFRIALERVTGQLVDDEQFETRQMRRGKELEAVARLKHEDEINVLIEHCSFVATDDELYGASADGFIEQNGTAEYKCFTDPAKLKRIILDKNFEDVMDQVQGQLWITEREFCDFCCYHPAIPMQRHRIPRDEAYIEELVSDLSRFDSVVDGYAARLGPLVSEFEVDNVDWDSVEGIFS
jgi:hypothetical protein